MVSTKHCCWGTCRRDPRYPDKLHKSLKELEAAGKKAFITFPKPSQGVEKCQRWINACSREGFTKKNVNRNTYICALHWPGEKGPTPDHPDPLKTNFTPRQTAKASATKRKPPSMRTMVDGMPPNKKTKNLSVEECAGMFPEVSPNQESVSQLEPNKRSPGPYRCSSTGMLVSDEGTQTEYCKYLLSAKIETMLLKNEVAKMKTQLNPSTKIVSSLSYEAISQDSSLMKHFVGLTSEQFRALHNFLNSISPLDQISYWYSEGQTENKIDNNGQEAKCSTEEMLYVCLLRLRRAYTIKSLAVILSTPNRTVKETLVRKIFTTYIQLLYKVFRDMQDVMFPTRGKMRHFLPKVFKTMKDVRCVVDCTEFHVQTSRNYARQ